MLHVQIIRGGGVMNPATLQAIMAALSGGAQAGAGGYSARVQDKASKRKSKEEQRFTRSRLLSDLLKQQLESALTSRQTQNELTGMRAKAYQDRAQAFRQSLLGG